MTKAGYVSIIGLPNSGKSSIINCLLGEKISIVTAKPQTTRKKIIGILSHQDYQIIFLDTPGILKPTYLLHEKMLEHIEDSIENTDIIIFVYDVSNPTKLKEAEENEIIKKVIAAKKKPIILALNKIDLTTEDNTFRIVEYYQKQNVFNAVIPISAAVNFNIKSLLLKIIELLPTSQKLYPDDYISTESEKFFVSEIIREKIFELYEDEIPYSTEVMIIEFKERSKGKDLIRAEIIIERDSQKAIIIGQDGKAIKRLGIAARKAIEDFLQRNVFLDLHLKVKEKWRDNNKLLKSFGYSIK